MVQCLDQFSPYVYNQSSVLKLNFCKKYFRIGIYFTKATNQLAGTSGIWNTRVLRAAYWEDWVTIGCILGKFGHYGLHPGKAGPESSIKEQQLKF